MGSGEKSSLYHIGILADIIIGIREVLIYYMVILLCVRPKCACVHACVPARTRVKYCEHPCGCVCTHTKHDAIIYNNYCSLRSIRRPRRRLIMSIKELIGKLLEYLSMINNFPEHRSNSRFDYETNSIFF